MKPRKSKNLQNDKKTNLFKNKKPEFNKQKPSCPPDTGSWRDDRKRT